MAVLHNCNITFPFVRRSDITENVYVIPDHSFFTFLAHSCRNILKHEAKPTHIVFQRLLTLMLFMLKVVFRLCSEAYDYR